MNLVATGSFSCLTSHSQGGWYTGVSVSFQYHLVVNAYHMKNVYKEEGYKNATR